MQATKIAEEWKKLMKGERVVRFYLKNKSARLSRAGQTVIDEILKNFSGCSIYCTQRSLFGLCGRLHKRKLSGSREWDSSKGCYSMMLKHYY